MRAGVGQGEPSDTEQISDAGQSQRMHYLYVEHMDSEQHTPAPVFVKHEPEL